MRRSPFPILLLLTGLSFQARGDNWLVSIQGMDCVTCQPKIEKAFSNIPGVQSVNASTPDASACVSTIDGKSLKAEVFQDSLIELKDYTVTNVVPIKACDEGTEKGRPVKLWSDSEGLDAKVISHSEEVELASAAVPGKFTIIDFGADWCTPCRAAETTLKHYLKLHKDTAVRAVAMKGHSPAQTFALPVALQHLKNAAGIPYFVVYGPTGKQIYKGPVVEKALLGISKKRQP